MKRLFAAGLMLAAICVSPAVAAAKAPVAAQYAKLYRQVVQKFSARTPGRNILRDGLASGRKASHSDLTRSIRVLERMLAPPPAAAVVLAATPTAITTAASAPSSAPAGGYADVPGVPSSFAACVAMQESTNGAGSSNIYGIEGSGGQGSLAEQKQAFSRMYAQRGVNPWQPYDGCG